MGCGMGVLRKTALYLKRAGLTINIAKSHFDRRSVRYLGHIIGYGKVRRESEKVKAIIYLHGLRRFMCLCGWYTKFVQNFASLSAPLTDLMKIKRRFSLTPEAIKAFESPDYAKPFAIYCGTSKTGVGAVLVQESEEGDRLPIKFISK